MSNAEIIRERLERWVRDRKLVPEEYAPDFVWDMSNANWPGADEFHGADGLQEFFREWLRPWDEWTYEIEDVLETPDGRVAVVGIQRGVNRGVPVEMRMTQVWSFDEQGRATRMEMYTDAEAGLAELGLKPPRN